MRAPTTVRRRQEVANVWTGTLTKARAGNRAVTAGMVAGWLFVFVSPAAFMIDVADDRSGSWEGIGTSLWSTMTIVLIVAMALTAVLMTGLKRETSLRAGGTAAVVMAAVAAVTGIAVWAIPVWGGLLGIAMLIVGLALLREGVAPRWAATAFSFGMLVGVGLYVILEIVGIGAIDEYGDHPAAASIGFAVMTAVAGAGAVGLSRWLRAH